MTTWSLPGFITAEPDTSLPVNMVEMYEAFDKELVYADNMGFAFDEEPVMTELAAIRQVTNEYYRALTAGRADPETELPQVPGCSEQRWSGNCPRRGAEPTECMARRSGQVIFDTISNLTFHYVGLDYFGERERGTCSFLTKIKNTSPSVPPTQRITILTLYRIPPHFQEAPALCHEPLPHEFFARHICVTRLKLREYLTYAVLCIFVQRAVRACIPRRARTFGRRRSCASHCPCIISPRSFHGRRMASAA